METKGESLLKGLEHMLGDISKGQLTHTDPEAFEVGRNIAVTPGKVVRRTPLYELIQYSPTTGRGARDPAGHLPALDQPLLHPRSQPEEELHPLGGRAGADRLRRLVEVGRREPRRDHARRLRASRPGRRDRHGARAARRGERPRHRLLRRRHHARRDPRLARGARRGGQGRQRHLLHRPGRFLRGRRPQPVRRRRDPAADRPDLGREGLSRRPLHGRHLQHAARAAT